MLHTYAGGTPSTPLATYSDRALTIPNANPIVASASGLFGPIYLTPSTAYYFVLTEANGTAIWDQDYVGTDLDLAPVISAAITAAVAAAVLPISQTETVTGAVVAIALTANCALLRLNNATLLTLGGLSGGLPGQRLIIESVGAGQVDLAHEAGGTSGAFRLNNMATSAPTSLAAGTGRATYVYDGTISRWVLAMHEQGAWITPTFNAANFTGSGAMTWTLTGGDQVTGAYRLSGRTITYTFNLATTSVGGVVAAALQIGFGAWGSFTIAQTSILLYLKDDNAGGNLVARLSAAGPGGTGLSLFNGTAAVNWTASANLTAVYGTVTFEVQ